jgi:dTDP-4-amino-4,6-dideoxygalactose transaminase
MKIEMVSLKRQYQNIKNDIDNAVQGVLDNCHFIMGPDVALLESEIAQYLNVKYAIGVASGTDALHLALLACGIGAGDEIITTPFTFIATCEAITYCRAVPVFVDIDPKTFNIDPEKIEQKISKRTKAILPVHMYGQAAEMDPILEIAGKHKIKVIEDVAQAFGGEYKDKKLGTLGDVGCTSFFPSKNLGAYGDGGMIYTNKKEIAEKVKLLRAHGSKEKYNHELVGYNSRLDTLQAAIVRVKLKRLDQWNNMRAAHAAKFNTLFSGCNLTTPYSETYNKHVYHLYALLIKNRDKGQEFLKSKGIASAIHYPIPAPLQKSYEHLGYSATDLPISYKVSQETLSLPMFPELNEEEINYIVKGVKDFLSASSV